MNTKGFLPLTTTGVILLILSSGLTIHLLWKNHVRKMQTMMQEEFDELDWRISFICATMREILRWSAEQALLEASQTAKLYHPDVEEAAGVIASMYFMRYLQTTVDLLKNRGEKINLSASVPVVKFLNAENFVIAQAYFPLGLSVELQNPTGMIVISRKIWKIETPIKVRFFLLENLMDNFIRNHRAKVLEALGKLLYLKTWSEALTSGVVHLDRNYDEMLFRYAWCMAEEEIFKSADWLDISGFEFFTERIELVYSEIRDLKELESTFTQVYRILHSLNQRIEAAVGGDVSSLEFAGKDLENAARLLRNVLDGEKFKSRMSNSIIQGMHERPKSDIPSIAEQLEIGISKLVVEMKTVQQKLKQGETATAENILRGILLTTRPREVPIEREFSGNKIRGVFKIYFDENSPPSITALLEIISGVLSDLAKIPLPELGSEPNVSQFSTSEMPRETYYRIFPPRPDRPPFVSVYHCLKIESIEYLREDLLGVAGSRTATPVYLPFLDVVVWWGQWNFVIKIEEGVEEIFDYPNQGLLQKTLLGYIHSCLSYRWEFEKKTFTVRIVIFSPEPFCFSEIL